MMNLEGSTDTLLMKFKYLTTNYISINAYKFMKITMCGKNVD